MRPIGPNPPAGPRAPTQALNAPNARNRDAQSNIYPNSIFGKLFMAARPGGAKFYVTYVKSDKLVYEPDENMKQPGGHTR